MTDAWLVIAIFLFAFILWVSTGGPSRPISFAGPYITPITDVGDVQTGYGEGIDTGDNESRSGVWSVKSIFGRFEGSLSDEAVGPVSPLQGTVEIVSGAGGPSGTNVQSEYVVVRAETETDITGWQLVSMKSGAGAVIPLGTIAPRANGGPLTSIVLAPEEEAIITTGRSPLGASFRENKCVAYLDDESFVPPLSSGRCPSPEAELGDFYNGSASAYDACRDVVSSLPRCEDVRAPSEARGDCASFIEQRLTYEGCVTGHFNDADFRGDTWRVYLNQSRELWRSDNETIKLIDAQGRTVDIYSY